MTNQLNSISINIASSREEIAECYPVMRELRPQFSLDSFVTQVEKQSSDFGFDLIYLRDGEIKSVAGIRISEWLAGGKYLAIDDLVSKSDERSKGYGGQLLDWIVDYAKTEKCLHIKLVSHIRRLDAHRFYKTKKMSMDAYYFSRAL